MRTRKNIEIRVSIEVVEIVGYSSNNVLAKAQREHGGTMDTKEIATVIKSLVMDARAQALDIIDTVATKDEAEEAAEARDA